MIDRWQPFLEANISLHSGVYVRIHIAMTQKKRGDIFRFTNPEWMQPYQKHNPSATFSRSLTNSPGFCQRNTHRRCTPPSRTREGKRAFRSGKPGQSRKENKREKENMHASQDNVIIHDLDASVSSLC